VTSLDNENEKNRNGRSLAPEIEIYGNPDVNWAFLAISAEDEYLHSTGLCMCLYVHASVGMSLYVPLCAYFVTENDVLMCVCVFMAWRKP
jgi:hypothetical protein